MIHMSFDMRAENKKSQGMYKWLAHHVKHVSVWLLFFHPFFFLSQRIKKQAAATATATTTEAGSTERAALAVDMDWLIYWCCIHTHKVEDNISQCPMVRCPYDCTKGLFTKKILAFGIG
jgi:hypothetical protein